MTGVDLVRLAEGIDQLTYGVGGLETEAEHSAPIDLPPMRSILVAVDAVDTSRIPLAWAARFAKVYGARVALVHVLPPPTYLTLYQGILPDLPQDVTGVLEERGARVLAATKEALAKHGVQAETILRHGSPVREVSELADSGGYDLVIVGSHERSGLERLLLGSVADGIKNHTHTSILIAKAEPTESPLLVAVDGSRASKRAAAFAADLAERTRTRATVLHVLPDLLNDLPEGAPRRLADVRTDLSRASPVLTPRLAQGNPVHEVLRVKDDGGHGLLVVGSRGLGGLQTAVLGSVSGSLSHQVGTSVLVVKTPPAR